MPGRSRAERRPDEKESFDPNPAEPPRREGVSAHGRGGGGRAARIARARKRQVRREGPRLTRKSAAGELARERGREMDERPASPAATCPDDLRRAPPGEAAEAFQLEVEARRFRRGRARRAAGVLDAAFGKLLEETKGQMSLRWGHPPKVAFGKPSSQAAERFFERRVVNGDGEKSADPGPSLLLFLALVGIGEEPRVRAGLAAEHRVSRANRAVSAEVLGTVRALLNEHARERLLAPLAEKVGRGVFVFPAPRHDGIIGASREAGRGGLVARVRFS